MSTAHYHKLWKEAQDELRGSLSYDAYIKKKSPIKNPDEAKWMIGHLFLSYVAIVNKLDQCYDQVVHPQKRELIGRLLDLTLGRILEVKRDIRKLELDDYAYYDNVLLELGLTPDDVQIRVPQCFWRDREKSRAHRRRLMQQACEEVRLDGYKEEYLKDVPDEEKEEKWAKYLAEREAERLEKEKLEEMQRKRLEAAAADAKPVIEDQEPEKTPQEVIDAVLLIQRHERARQGRRDLPLHKRRRMIRMTGRKFPKVPEDIANRHARVIQRHWRRHRRRVLAHRRLLKEMVLLGMIEPSWKDLTCFEKVQQVLQYKRKMQDRNRDEYVAALDAIKEKMTKLYSASMQEDITDEIRYWFEWFFLQTESLPDYPGEDPVIPTGEILGIPKMITKDFIERNFPPVKLSQTPIPKSKLAQELNGVKPLAGSALVVAEHWIGPREFLLCQKEVERMLKSAAASQEAPKKEDKKKDKKASAAAKKEKEAARKRMLAEEALGFRPQGSDFLAPLMKADKDYKSQWEDADESNNYEQRYVYDIIKTEKCLELSMEVRRIVDEAMRVELEVLKDALERDRNPKKKKRKTPRKPKPKTKGKKEKFDPTKHRTNDDLFKEMYKNGIIRDYEEAHLKDFVGERSFTAFDLRRRLEDGPPSPGDVRDLLLQLCILPLGSSRVHQMSPVTRAVCLIGPEQCGKEFLGRVICTETAAVMFDLTPENTVGKYTSKSEMKMLLHLVEKMSRVLQPSVIFVDGAEKHFYKKVPKEEKKYDPKRFGAILPKIAKGIKAEDQVLVVGVSSNPWLCPKPKLTKTYDAFIYVPQPDYGTYFMLWQKLLVPYHSIPRDFDFSCLAKASKGYTVKTVTEAVRKVLTANRVGRSRYDPIRPVEFVEELMKVEPLQDKTIQKCMEFYNSTDLRKKRLNKLTEARLALEKAKKKKK